MTNETTKQLHSIHRNGVADRPRPNGAVFSEGPVAASPEPDWRREFPVATSQDNDVTRRGFIKFLGLTSLAFVVGQFWVLVQNWRRKRRGLPPIRAIARLEDVPIGGTMTFTFPDKHDKCLLLRPDAKTLIAYDQRCTHLSCTVVPKMDEKCLLCPCHKGSFDLATGRPIAGPPRRPLTRIQLEIRGETVYATGLELRTV